MEKGRVIEEGSHSSLMQTSIIYKKLQSTQEQ